jgi:site-specific DNA recombinase
MEAISGHPAIYARFSSARQDERSIDDQVRRCRAHLGDHKNEVEVFADYAISGAGLNRPGFEALMAAVDSGLVTSIVTEDISRISRDFADAAQIFRRLQYTRVPLVGVADGIDTSAKHAKLTYTLKSLVADLYLDDLRDKTLRGLEGRMLADFATGQVPYGYRTRAELDARGRELGKRIEIDELAAKVVIRIFTDYANPWGRARIGVVEREGSLAHLASPAWRPNDGCSSSSDDEERHRRLEQSAVWQRKVRTSERVLGHLVHTERYAVADLYQPVAMNDRVFPDEQEAFNRGRTWLIR